ncbi:MAG: sigma-54-dependent transcriptional regulator, partial [Gemmatimonadaceae bacterium]
EMAECALVVRRGHLRRLLLAENSALRERLASLEPVELFVAEAATMQSVLDFLAGAGEEAPVLIIGDRGTGKTALARMMHDRSDRRSRPYLSFDCSAAEPGSHEGRLFGSEKVEGSPSVRTLEADSFVQVPGIGLLELASGGTLCLDEVGMLDGNVQTRLYNALESNVFHRMKGTQRVPLQTRLLATSRTRLEPQVAAGTFNAGLYHYLNGRNVSLPRLRERMADLELLVEHFVQVFGGLNPPTLSAGAVAALRGYRWPGNLTELRAVIERTVLLARGPVILERDIVLANAGVHSLERPGESSSLDDIERNVIAQALAQTGWHRRRAAEILGVSPKTLWRKIRRYGFSRPASARALASESRDRE